eukprot:2173-Rhodomonas_salina.5
MLTCVVSGSLESSLTTGAARATSRCPHHPSSSCSDCFSVLLSRCAVVKDVGLGLGVGLGVGSGVWGVGCGTGREVGLLPWHCSRIRTDSPLPALAQVYTVFYFMLVFLLVQNFLLAVVVEVRRPFCALSSTVCCPHARIVANPWTFACFAPLSPSEVDGVVCAQST